MVTTRLRKTHTRLWQRLRSHRLQALEILARPEGRFGTGSELAAAAKAWAEQARRLVEAAFPDDDSIEDVIFPKGANGPGNLAITYKEGDRWREWLLATVQRFEAVFRLLEFVSESNGPFPEAQGPSLARKKRPRRIFLVHGHTERTTRQVAGFLRRLGVAVTILRQQPNRGRTIIEKLLAYGDVAFAVVLLTGDDLGRARRMRSSTLFRRARQNVVLELGYFLARLGRERTCALYEDGVEIPSDYHGVLFVRLDSKGTWKSALLREMKAAGLRVRLSVRMRRLLKPAS